jgi:hypothetical protein
MSDGKTNVIKWGLVCTSIGVFVTTIAKVVVDARGNYRTPLFDILDNFSSLATLLWFIVMIFYFRTLRRGTPSY